MLTIGDVKNLYGALAEGANIREIEADEEVGPELKEWRNSLEKGGVNNRLFWPLATLGLRGQDADGKGYHTETLFSLMKSDPSWILELASEVRELGTWMGVETASLEFNPDMVAPWVIKWDKEHPAAATSNGATTEISGDLESDLEALVGAAEARGTKYPQIRKWIRYRLQELTNSSGNGGTGPIAKAPSKFGSLLRK